MNHDHDPQRHERHTNETHHEHLKRLHSPFVRIGLPVFPSGIHSISSNTILFI